MIQIAKDVFQIPVMPRQLVNTYLIGSTLIDAGIKVSGRTILRQLGNHKLTAHALTHAHPDHQGASAELCKKLGIPFWVGAKDKSAAESGLVVGAMPNPKHPVAIFEQNFMAGPGHPVDRILQEGDRVEDFVVIETPGHSAGHVCFWRERDGVLIAGDVLRNINFFTTMPELNAPPAVFTTGLETKPQIHQEDRCSQAAGDLLRAWSRNSGHKSNHQVCKTNRLIKNR
ncbi:MAG: MBL fold metallo-hydrolase [Anaerolineales bacterium]|uniref:MBL fold metallo-hydrolase n=1 Tax=Candidatus Villigracilis proximus TaxID=3140683 RepID=UPI0031365CCD|nr:MBL fold metallo-hydrolase [Anaerolineales bacterium]